MEIDPNRHYHVSVRFGFWTWRDIDGEVGLGMEGEGGEHRRAGL